MARKRAANPSASMQAPDSPTSPGNGAMDSLLEKLRAAGQPNRDQRDRRRRARLKEKHQMRIASGERMLDIGDLTKDAEGTGDTDSPDLLSPITALAPVPEVSETKAERLSRSDRAESTDRGAPALASEGEDVADRAAQLLQGLRNNTSSDGPGAGSIRVRRRREGNEEERRARRRRRAGDDSAEPSPTTEQPQGGQKPGRTGGSHTRSESNLEMPVTTVSPPTPERGSEARPVSLSD